MNLSKVKKKDNFSALSYEIHFIFSQIIRIFYLIFLDSVSVI